MNKLILLLRQPEDVDLYTGALSEYPLKGAIVGPLLACIIGDQFLRLKVGDSHWYERPRGPQKFTNGLNIDDIDSDNIDNDVLIFFFQLNLSRSTTLHCRPLSVQTRTTLTRFRSKST
jgi:Animal haem peroxidase